MLVGVWFWHIADGQLSELTARNLPFRFFTQAILSGCSEPAIGEVSQSTHISHSDFSEAEVHHRFAPVKNRPALCAFTLSQNQ
jgi:hypothetical protein